MQNRPSTVQCNVFITFLLEDSYFIPFCTGGILHIFLRNPQIIFELKNDLWQITKRMIISQKTKSLPCQWNWLSHLKVSKLKLPSQIKESTRVRDSRKWNKNISTFNFLLSTIFRLKWYSIIFDLHWQMSVPISIQ